MKFRHNFAAHSGAERFEFVEVALVFPYKTKKPILPMLFRELTQPDLFLPVKGEIKLSDLFEHAREVAAAKADRLSQKILNEEIYPKGLSYWLKK
jgi:hypothetical protein